MNIGINGYQSTAGKIDGHPCYVPTDPKRREAAEARGFVNGTYASTAGVVNGVPAYVLAAKE